MGDSDTDSFSGVFENILAGQNFARSGTVVIEADGYGSAVLPYGILEDVLRVKAVSTYTDEFNGQQLFSYSETQYLWYQAETNSYIATYNELYVNGTISARVAGYLSEEDYLSVTETLANAELSVYPNPSSDFVNVELPSSETFEYTITDAQGKTVISGTTKDVFNRTMIVNGLETGMYILQVSNEADSFAKRFIIE